jgi:ferric-dicitrate binding protein FerR (iron transport regulator)
MEKSFSDSALIRFLKKETTASENAKILQWVSQSDENRIEFRKVHQTWHMSRLKSLNSEIDMDEAWDKLQAKIPKKPQSTFFVNSTLWGKIAASVIVVLAVGFGSIWVNNQFFDGKKVAMIQFEVPSGEKSKMILADGTHVWLNSETTLKYDALDPRKVFLEGEAYFEVEKDTEHPFEVATASGMKVNVLGTKFNLRCFANEAEVVTTLEEGQVEIIGESYRRPLLLQPGQQAVYYVQNNKMVVCSVPVDLYSLWRNNELYLEDVPFKELVAMVERWYGVSIGLDPKLSRTDRFTMTIKTESLRELLEMMKLTSNFDYEINGERVKINAR